MGYIKESPVENIVVKDNIIIGRNNALRILHAKSLIFKGNRVYSGYVALQASALEHIDNWKFNDNTIIQRRVLVLEFLEIKIIILVSGNLVLVWMQIVLGKLLKNLI